MPSTDRRGLSPLAAIVEAARKMNPEEFSRLYSNRPASTGGGSVIPNSLLRTIRNIPPLGGSIGFTPMAHPVWPYGTVIKPTPDNDHYDPDHRYMVIGMNEHRQIEIVLLDVGGKAPYWGSSQIYAENAHELWEEVPD